jgi:hypothetical protein
MIWGAPGTFSECQLLNPRQYIFSSAAACEQVLKQFPDVRNENSEYKFRCVHKTAPTWKFD